MNALQQLLAKTWRLNIGGIERLDESRHAYRVFVDSGVVGCYDGYYRYFDKCCDAFWYWSNFTNRLIQPEKVIVKGVN